MFFVYILKSINKEYFYIGQTNNLKKRLKRHNDKFCLSTKSYAPFKLLYFEKYQTRSEAVKRERYFKSIKNMNYLKHFFEF